MEEHQDYSLGSRVFQKIREDILNGRYKEHDELRENTLGKELGVSRTPVREALRQLELEGLVTIIPNRGAYVTGISRKDIWDIYVMRSMLEGLCARWAAEHITDEQLDELELPAEHQDLPAQHDAVYEEGKGAQRDAGEHIGEHIGQTGYCRSPHSGQGNQRNAQCRAQNACKEYEVPPEQTGMRHVARLQKIIF